MAAGLAALAVNLAALIYPVYVIRPFRAQGIQELSVALTVMRYRGPLTAIAALLAGVAAYYLLCSAASRWSRVLTVAAAFLAFGAAALCRVNIYERMFHPNSLPSFSPVAASKLDAKEKVIAILAGGQARAYPIRAMAYHHVINDELAGFPLVATY